MNYKTFFPEYMVDSIRRRWGEKNISQELALKHLQLLKGIFQGLPADVAMYGPKAVLEAKKAEEKAKLEEEKAKIEARVPKVAKVKKIKKIAKVKTLQKGEVAPGLDKTKIKKLWADFKTETVKVKRAITSNLFDVALAPLERAKSIISAATIFLLYFIFIPSFISYFFQLYFLFQFDTPTRTWILFQHPR